jgi:hypothetical protein
MTEAVVINENPSHGRCAGLWAGVIGSAVIWAIQLQTIYAISPWLCRHGHYSVSHLLTLLFLVGTAVCAVLSWRDYKAVGGGDADETDGGPVPRTRFLGMLGTLVSSMFFMLIVAQGIAGFFIDACWL